MTIPLATDSGAQDTSTDSSEIISLFDEHFFLFAADEASLWTQLDEITTRAILFWAKFLDLRMGNNGKLANDNGAKDRLMKIVRAVSWVESKHGTGTGNHPDIDPIQCGNPDDSWWRELCGNLPPGRNPDRFVGGPDAKNYDADELPDGVIRDGQGFGFPSEAELSLLDDIKKGHRDGKFNRTMGFFWGVPHLVWKINVPQRGKVFKCGDFTREDLINGAVAYNGGGDPNYEQKIRNALVLIGWNTVILEQPIIGKEPGISSLCHLMVEDKLRLLQGAASVLEGMAHHFAEEREGQNPRLAIAVPTSLRVKVGDIELEATFSREVQSCSENV